MILRSLLYYVREKFPTSNVQYFVQNGEHLLVLSRGSTRLAFKPEDAAGKLYSPEEVAPILDAIEHNFNYQVDTYYEPENDNGGSKSI